MIKKLLFFILTILTITASAQMLVLNDNVVGLPTTSVDTTFISNAYPNPASSVVYFDYKLSQSIANAKINISNLLGMTVNSVSLMDKSGKTGINVGELKDGIYFYSLLINNSATITRKFVVKR